jgi:hypothetical protein
MVTNSTNINKRTTTSQLKSLNRKKDHDITLVWLHISTVLKLGLCFSYFVMSATIST